ncbi:hypothetical protein [Castellaniella sp.]|uniref:hypothetical protein n=1 Tax=Castellaniella sp. TaxID=1955812 RepID=UPI002B001A2A|nr:hypothetical protein [Castellaniella sp.]
MQPIFLCARCPSLVAFFLSSAICRCVQISHPALPSCRYGVVQLLWLLGGVVARPGGRDPGSYAA